ncbi:3'-5' exonuclease [Bacillus solimangrovi]|uniref:DNA polymerase III subunit epsilon n=1 Tax=Bacillus solimangrovi TaxID=1305675 RepID=A0A1E5LGY1_9BACI|nr:exonuclease domain-containing protein [Bacillus solimangrovi]OEH93337.1 DNA polymerase III subunit epsilon [Bacillus solimangrovi]
MFWLRKSLNCPLDESQPLNTPLEQLNFTVYDTETTGFQVATTDRMIEIGAVNMKGMEVLDKDTFQIYVDPNRTIPNHITELTGITNEKVEGACKSLYGIEQFFDFVQKNESVALVGHYVEFDLMVLKHELRREKLNFKKPHAIDTLDLIGFLAPAWDMRELERYAMAFGTRIYERHSAIGDALTTAYLFSELLRLFRDRGYDSWGELIKEADSQSRTLSF